MPRDYPADPADAALGLFLGWFGSHYARSVTVDASENDGNGVLSGSATVGRRWKLQFAVANTLALEADFAWEAARAALEKRLDDGGIRALLWAPRGAKLPNGEPGFSQVALALEAATTLGDGRMEVRRPVSLYLRRTSTTGSVMTVLGGMSSQWAQFTNRIPGSFQLNSAELFRLPASGEERTALVDRIVHAAGQPEADDSQAIGTEDVWTANPAPGDRSVVLGSPRPENDEQSSALRRNMRILLRQAQPVFSAPADARALVVLGAATYADEEKLSWALRGMDPSLYAGYDIVVVIADGLVKPLLQPGRQTLPWDAPLPG